MNWKLDLIAAACVLAAMGVATAEEPVAVKPEPATPAVAPAPSGVAATVGEVQIMREQVEKPLKDAPPGFPAERLEAVRQQVLGGMITSELIHAYVAARSIPVDPNLLAEAKKSIADAAKEQSLTVPQIMDKAGLTEEKLKDQVRLKKVMDDATAKDKVDAFVKAHPACFNGTKVQASHVLIACEPTAGTAEQKAAVAKIEKIAADVAAKKVTFADAAKEHSTCPSGKRAGGDLGEFEFSRMVPPFALKAFAMKVGETSGIVRTQFGFHVIQVTKRTEGADQPAPDATDIAERVLVSQLQNRIFDQALTTCPIIIH